MFKKICIFARDCVLIELILPISPLLIQFGIKSIWSDLRADGDPTLLQPTLATSAMMLPLVLFIRSKKGAVHYLYLSAFAAGTILYTLSLVFTAPIWHKSHPHDLILCFQCAGIGLVFSSVLRGISQLSRAFVTSG